MAFEPSRYATCPHGLKYDANQHIGCVVCRREAGEPSLSVPAEMADDSGTQATKLIFGAIVALAVAVVFAAAAVKLLGGGAPETEVAQMVPGPARDLEEARGQVQVTMYTTSWCPHCVRAKLFMNQEGIRFTEHDVEASDEARAARDLINPRGGVPTFDIDGDVLVGFSAAALSQKIDQAAEQRL